MVDTVKSTNGGLRNISVSVDYSDMMHRPDYSAIGARLTKIRTGFSDLSQKAWAEKNGFSVTQYNNWEKGTRRISVDAAEELVERYSVTLDYIFRGNEAGLSEKVRNSL